MQLLDDARHPDARRPQTACGALYDLLAPVDKRTLTAGIYHSARVVLRAGNVEHWLDGETVLHYAFDSSAFRDAVARSKFKALPGFAGTTSGHIVLQHHGDAVAFRNIEIRT